MSHSLANEPPPSARRCEEAWPQRHVLQYWRGLASAPRHQGRSSCASHDGEFASFPRATLAPLTRQPVARDDALESGARPVIRIAMLAVELARAISRALWRFDLSQSLGVDLRQPLLERLSLGLRYGRLMRSSVSMSAHVTHADAPPVVQWRCGRSVGARRLFRSKCTPYAGLCELRTERRMA